jgi:hypothetical protein
LASIEQFLTLAEAAPAVAATRLSLLRLGPPQQNRVDRHAARERALIVVAIGVLELLMVIALRDAMRPSPVVEDADSEPLLITFIERPPAAVVPAPTLEPPRETPQSRVRAASARPLPRRVIVPATPPRVAAEASALQADAVSSHAAAETQPASRVDYDPAGSLIVAKPATPFPQPRDLLAHRSVDYMLPGGPNAHAPNLPVGAGASPKDVMNRVAAFLGGGPIDPCPRIEQNMVDLNDARAREEAEEHYERACEGR